MSELVTSIGRMSHALLALCLPQSGNAHFFIIFRTIFLLTLTFDRSVSKCNHLEMNLCLKFDFNSSWKARNFVRIHKFTLFIDTKNHSLGARHLNSAVLHHEFRPAQEKSNMVSRAERDMCSFMFNMLLYLCSVQCVLSSHCFFLFFNSLLSRQGS